MKYAQTVTYIRQLCCLGLRGEIIMPALLEATRLLVPADFNSFFWAGEDYELCNMYSENSAMYQYAPVYFGEYYNQKEIPVIGVGFSQAMRRGHLFGNSVQFGKRFWNTNMYDDLWRVVNVRHVLEVTVSERGRGWGVLKSSRGIDSRPFSVADESRLKAVAPYIAHAIKAPVTTTFPMVANGVSGVIIVDYKNRIVNCSDDGLLLLRLSSHKNLATSSGAALALPPALSLLCDDLRAVMRGNPLRPPVLFHSSPWGNFVFRGYWLNNAEGSEGGLISILIEQQIPMALKLMQSKHMKTLTAKEREVCLFLFQGFSHPEIALKMGVKLNTLVDYIRSIYNKLDVHNRAQLLSLLDSGNERILTKI